MLEIYRKYKCCVFIDFEYISFLSPLSFEAPVSGGTWSSDFSLLFDILLFERVLYIKQNRILYHMWRVVLDALSSVSPPPYSTRAGVHHIPGIFVGSQFILIQQLF